MNSETVVIEDEDVDMVIIEDDEKINSKKANETTVETIVLDDELSTGDEMDKNDSPITNNKTSSNISEKSFINSLRNNNLIDKIVKTCLNMEHSAGMSRVIEKTLLPLYKDASNRFKETKSFKQLLKKTYKMLVRDPDHKFLHIKTLCEELKSGGLRRKVPFVTLATNLSYNVPIEKGGLVSSSRNINENTDKNKLISKVNKTPNKRTRKKPVKPKLKPRDVINNTNRRSVITFKEKEKTDIIEFDIEPDIVESDHSDNEDVIILDEIESTDNVNDIFNITPKKTEIVASNKENNAMKDEFLVPKTQVNVTVESIPDHIKIAQIEQKIAVYQKMISELEKAEVISDTESPYIECARYKKAIVELYKKLCKLHNTAPELAKRCEIRLHVAEGHPPGPAKRLEHFLNNSIKRTGIVEFPDFNDVVACVCEANIADKLGWKGQQLLQEAAALFRECGQALRKRRQKREYRDLLSLVNNKEPTDDPAENDPSLLVKLELNKILAKVKEEEILEKYVNMEMEKSSQHPSAEIVSSAVPTYGNTRVEFESDKDSSDSEAEIEIDLHLSHDKTNSSNSVKHSQLSNNSTIANESLKDQLVTNNTTNVNNRVKPLSNNSNFANKTLKDLLLSNDTMIPNKSFKDIQLPNHAMVTTEREKDRLPLNNDPITNSNNQYENINLGTNNYTSYTNADNPETRYIVVTPSSVDNQCEISVSSTSNLHLQSRTTTVSPPIVINDKPEKTLQSTGISNNNLHIPPISNIIINEVSISSALSNNNLHATSIQNCKTPLLENLLQGPVKPPNRAYKAVREKGESSKSTYVIESNLNVPLNTKDLSTDTSQNECIASECSEREDVLNNNFETTSSNLFDNFPDALIKEDCEISVTSNYDENSEVKDGASIVNSNSSHKTAEINCDPSETKDIKVKIENIKREPIDVQAILDELGDNFVCTVLDIEDPFLVIEISSDEYSDDEL